MEISTQIIELRKSLKLTQKKFANILKITQANVSLIENQGQDISSKTIYKILDAFPDIDLNWLFKGTDEPLLQKYISKNVQGKSHEERLEEIILWKDEEIKSLKEDKKFLKEVLNNFMNK